MLEESIKNIKKLQDRIQKSKYTEAIPFVGAGSSIPLGLPLWEQLVQDFHNEVNCNIPFDELKEYHDRNWPIISDKIFESIEGGVENKFAIYNEFMSQKFQPKTCDWTSVHIEIIDLFEKIITTNYDRAFENVLKRNLNHEKYPEEIRKSYNYDFLYYPGKLEPIYGKCRWIAYLHGRNDSKKYVFREKEYTYAYNEDNEITTFLNSIIKVFPIIFLGFSFDDVNFKVKLQEIINKKKVNLNRRYEVFGAKDELDSEIAGLFVIIHKKDLDDRIDNNTLKYFFNGKHEEIKDIIKISQTEHEGFSRIELISGNNTIERLKEIFKGNIKKLEEFNKKIKSLSDIRKKKKYFEDNGIKTIEYSGNHTNIIEILKKIMDYEIHIKNEQGQFPDTI